MKGGLVCAPSMSLSEITIFLVKSGLKTSVRSGRFLNRFPNVFFPEIRPSVRSVRAPSASLSSYPANRAENSSRKANLAEKRSEQKRFSMKKRNARKDQDYELFPIYWSLFHYFRNCDSSDGSDLNLIQLIDCLYGSLSSWPLMTQLFRHNFGSMYIWKICLLHDSPLLLW